jgi:hypothetical protein
MHRKLRDAGGPASIMDVDGMYLDTGKAGYLATVCSEHKQPL